MVENKFILFIRFQVKSVQHQSSVLLNSRNLMIYLRFGNIFLNLKCLISNGAPQKRLKNRQNPFGKFQIIEQLFLNYFQGNDRLKPAESYVHYVIVNIL